MVSLPKAALDVTQPLDVTQMQALEPSPMNATRSVTVQALPTHEHEDSGSEFGVVVTSEPTIMQPAKLRELRKYMNDRKTTIQHVFKNLDTSGNGRLTLEELKEGLTEIGLYAGTEKDDEEAEKMFNFVDIESTGVITYDKIKRHLRPVTDGVVRIQSYTAKAGISGKNRLSIRKVFSGAAQHRSTSVGGIPRYAVVDLHPSRDPWSYVKTSPAPFGGKTDRFKYHSWSQHYNHAGRETAALGPGSYPKFVPPRRTRDCAVVLTPAQQKMRKNIVDNLSRVIDLFRLWDRDGSGSVSPDEFTKALRKLGVRAHADDVDAIFDSFDIDGSGEIEFAELEEFLRTSGEAKTEEQERLERAEKVAKLCMQTIKGGRTLFGKEVHDAATLFQAMDKDNGGWLSKDEIEISFKRFGFSKADSDSTAFVQSLVGDGDITLDEFVADMEKLSMAKFPKKTVYKPMSTRSKSGTVRQDRDRGSRTFSGRTPEDVRCPF